MEASDNCFTTLFMWQDPYGIRWAEENGVLYIKVVASVSHSFLPPFAGKEMQSSLMVCCVLKNGS